MIELNVGGFTCWCVGVVMSLLTRQSEEKVRRERNTVSTER